MIKIHHFVFNPFSENTYILSDETGKAVIVDAGCHNQQEEDELSDYIKQAGLEPAHHLLTHTHIDHIFGVGFIYRAYGLRPTMHKAGLPFLRAAKEQAIMFGVEDIEIIEPDTFIEDGTIITFGNSTLETLYTPGHIDGHVCFVSKADRFVVVGDVIFRESVGRWDLPSGNEELLAKSIKNKIYTLDKKYRLLPGHGPETTVGHEMLHNPFVSE
jgi:hydroxyacylglutathione hydrolase